MASVLEANAQPSSNFSLDESFDDNWYEDSASNGYDVAEIDREREKRRSYFHTIGYRDGLTAGKEASAQEGFNTGFKESVVIGYNLGLVRGFASAMSNLPEPLRNKLANTSSARSQVDNLSKSVQSISRNDVMEMLNERMSTDAPEQAQDSCHSSSKLNGKSSKDDQLEDLSRNLKSLLQECPEIKLRYDIGQASASISLSES